MSIICAVSRGHNASTTLLVDGEIIFYVEEERLSRFKRDGTPFLGIQKVFEYVDHIDELVVCHTHRACAKTDWTGEDIYKAMVRKLSRRRFPFNVTYIDSIHHKMHAICGFIHSGFDTAACLIADGAGSFLQTDLTDETVYEFETIFHAKSRSPIILDSVYKHLGTDDSIGYVNLDPDTNCILTEFPGIVKAYEAVTRYCGFNSIEAGKTMGLAAYGKPDPNMPFKICEGGFINRNIFNPNYPNGAYVIGDRYDYIKDDLKKVYEQFDFDKLKYAPSSVGKSDWNQWLLDDKYKHTEGQKNLAYAMQKTSEEMIGDLIQKAHDLTGEKNIVISGGYGLNCVANYKFKKRFPDFNIFVEPISHDGGTSLGGAYFVYDQKYLNRKNNDVPVEYNKLKPQTSLYYGPQYNPDLYLKTIKDTGDDRVQVSDTSVDDVAQLIRDGNIVTIFQGRSEAGPRALGNRSILFDPTIKDGKDIVNRVKKREFFRPFACSILAEKVHDWFDLAGMDETPHMMYAVECLDGVSDKIPSVIHEDGTCRIQTVTKEQNENYYNLISAFEKLSDVPIVFNTSFNMGGDALVENLYDALESLAYLDIKYMYLPEIGKLITMDFVMERPDLSFVQDISRDPEL